MSETYLARHPVPVLGIPRRASTESLFYDRAATPVRLREVAPEEVPLAFTRHEMGMASPYLPEQSIPVHVMGGRPWIPFPAGKSANSRESFIAFLEGDERFTARAGYLANALLARTPLMACRRRGMVMLDRGRDLKPSDVRSISERDDQRASAGLVRFLDEEVALAGDKAFVRASGPAAGHWLANEYKVLLLPRYRELERVTVLDPRGVDRHWEWYRNRPTISAGDRKRFRDLTPRLIDGPDDMDLERLDLGLSGEADVWLTANEAADEVMGRAWSLSPATREVVEHHGRELSRDSMWGSVGAIDEAATLQALHRVSAFAREVAALHPKSSVAEFGRMIEEVAIPRATEIGMATSLGEEDLAALEGMHP